MYRVRASTSGILKDLRKDMKRQNKLGPVTAKTHKWTMVKRRMTVFSPSLARSSNVVKTGAFRELTMWEWLRMPANAMPIECQSLKLDLKSLWKAGLIFNPFAPVASCHGNSPVAGLAQSWTGLLLKAAITPWVRIATAFSMSWKDEAYRLVNGEGDGLSGLIAKHLMAKLFEEARTITWEQNRAHTKVDVYGCIAVVRVAAYWVWNLDLCESLRTSTSISETLSKVEKHRTHSGRWNSVNILRGQACREHLEIEKRWHILWWF